MIINQIVDVVRQNVPPAVDEQQYGREMTKCLRTRRMDRMRLGNSLWVNLPRQLPQPGDR